MWPDPVGTVDISGGLARIGDRERPVFAVIAHDLAVKPGQHVAVGVIAEDLR